MKAVEHVLPPDLLTLSQAARRLGINAQTAQRFAKAGTFPGDAAIRVGARWVVSVPRLERYLHGIPLEAHNATGPGGSRAPVA